MDEAEYCNRLSIMRDGEIIAIGPPSELKTLHKKSSMQDVFIAIVNGEEAS